MSRNTTTHGQGMSRIMSTQNRGGLLLMKNDSKVVSFRTNSIVSRLSEKFARQRGQTRSEFFNLHCLDSILNYELSRQKDSINDFLNLLLPNITKGMDEEQRNELIKNAVRIQTEFFKNRLPAYMKYQRHLTDTALKSFLQGYMDDLKGMKGQDAFIVNQCLVSVYDFLREQGLITKAEWQNKTLFYTDFMEQEGHKLILKD